MSTPNLGILVCPRVASNVDLTCVGVSRRAISLPLLWGKCEYGTPCLMSVCFKYGSYGINGEVLSNRRFDQTQSQHSAGDTPLTFEAESRSKSSPTSGATTKLSNILRRTPEVFDCAKRLPRSLMTQRYWCRASDGGDMSDGTNPTSPKIHVYMYSQHDLSVCTGCTRSR